MDRLKNKYVKYAALGLCAFAFFIILFGFGIYQLKWDSKSAYYVSKVLPYPAILVDWEIIPFSMYIDDLRTLNQYWNYQRENKNVLLGIPDEREIRERLVSKLIKEKIIQILARKNGIYITDEEKYLEWERLKAKPDGDDEITQFLNDAYGWSEERFIGRVLHPFLLQQKVKAMLSESIGDDEDELKQDALEIYVLSSEEGADFSDIAKQYSADAKTGANGGDLGYFARGTMDPVLEEAIFSMKIGQISEPIKSSYGYHIIKLEDILHDSNGLATQARARHILIRGFDFEEWIEQKKIQTAIYRLVL